MVTPLVLLAAIAAWAWVSRAAQVSLPATPAAVPAQATQQTPTAAPGVIGLPGLATPWAVAGMEPLVSPAATATGPAQPIRLLGPPPGSQFGADDLVSFYWRWPGELEEGQRFVVYVVAGGNRVALGAIDEANMGQAYHLATALGGSVGKTGGFQWLVVLEDAEAATTIGQSEPRPIGIVGR